MMNNIRADLKNFKKGHSDLINALKSIPKKSWNYSPGKNKWNIKQVILHLADAEMQSYVRFRTIIAESGAAILNHDQDKWAKEANQGSENLKAVLESIKIVRHINYKLLSKIPKSSWKRFAIHSIRGKVTLEDLLKTYSGHINQHIKQIQRNYNEWNFKEKSA